MTLQDRIEAYAKAFPKRPPLQLVTEGAGKDKHEVLYGQMVIGAAYGNDTRYYGAHPRGYLARIMALFPDVVPSRLNVLHAFSGSLPKSQDYSRCDSHQPAEYRMPIEDLPANLSWKFPLITADPPYTALDATKYGTKMIDRGRVMRALAEVTAPRGHVVWLDCCWPMHRKDQWRTVGRIGLTRSTNHRVRMVSIFERVAT